jgi:hypothetical protein
MSCSYLEDNADVTCITWYRNIGRIKSMGWANGSCSSPILLYLLSGGKGSSNGYSTHSVVSVSLPPEMIGQAWRTEISKQSPGTPLGAWM